MTDNIIADEYGPEMVIKLYDKKIGLEGFLVIDNTVLGTAKGGIRMTPNVTVEEIARLARTMTWKNALAEMPFGGGKAGIVWKGGSQQEKKILLQSFAKAIALLTPKKYITAPDVGTGEEEMAWFVEATGNWKSATGKPVNLCMKVFGKKGEKCGIPHEFGSTGWGVAQSTKVAAEMLKIEIKGAKTAIHGFGNVGTFTYTYLTEMGVKVILLADKSGVVYSESGFDQKKIKEIINSRQPLINYKGGKKISSKEFWKIPTDILIPASVTNVINDENKKDIKTKLIVQAGNIPMQEKIEDEFFRKGIMIIPDFVANAGGVISSYAEYRGYNPKKMFDTIKKKIIKTTKQVVKIAIKQNKNPRQAALELAQKKIAQKLSQKRENG